VCPEKATGNITAQYPHFLKRSLTVGLLGEMMQDRNVNQVLSEGLYQRAGGGNKERV
jgi:hypothetical protein